MREYHLQTILRSRRQTLPVTGKVSSVVTAGMKTDVSQPPVPTRTPASSVDPRITREPIAQTSLRPRRFRGYLWNPTDSFVTPLATLSETLRPLPRPPPSELANAAALDTINHHPELFKVSTPVNVDRFEYLLRDHPNRPLVNSVCDGLRFGFWPFAEPDLEAFPLTLEMDNGQLSAEEERFILDYIEEERSQDRFSPPFGPDLLPGMYAMPVYTIPKADSSKLRLINNHSAGPFALNAMIDKAHVGMRPDNVQDLGRNLLAFRKIHGNIPLWLFKSDVSNAYRHLPMHPLWQIRQIVKIANRCHVDWCCCFGSRGSPDIWTSFICLVLWIAIHVKLIELLLAFMDDHFSFDPAHALVYYPPYDAFFPDKQVRLLQLWDEIGIRHSKSKQVFGTDLTIIGFHVDSSAMTISLPSTSLQDLVDHIRAFCLAPQRRHSLRDWQRLLGWINWALNVQPLLRPALQSSYEKIRGRSNSFAQIYINRRVRTDLLWAADILRACSGLYILRSLSWSPQEANLTFYCDACLTGMGFWSPQLSKGFSADTIPSFFKPDDTIFWFEALTVLAVISYVSSLSSSLLSHPFRLAIFSDNLNTVQMFDSFRSHPPYDLILLASIRLMLIHSIDVRVWHIPGHQNPVADALSRGLFDTVRFYQPHLLLYTFEPPRVTLGEEPK